MGIFKRKETAKRTYIRIGDFRVNPDIVAGYFPIKRSDELCGIRLLFANGRFVELSTTKDQQRDVIELLDCIKRPITV